MKKTARIAGQDGAPYARNGNILDHELPMRGSSVAAPESNRACWPFPEKT
jgi:hypothetical protein